eukprot:TRINITY_DN2221_c0_g2_i1.p1 TRINITY_DN2221_c0_g2~~TRINITY_DN2221_c0_g2_i1.p1  ORF type:complete len:249 (+),score=62.96 TRINITY_DN2221_c0_g2_i1:85-747(+)
MVDQTFKVDIGSLVEAFALSDSRVNGLRGVVTKIQPEGRFVVDLPIGKAALKEENLKVITSCGSWELVTSSSMSPGDSYWYNYETEASCWEVPQEILNITKESTTDDSSLDASNSESSRKRSYTGIESEGSEQTEDNDSEEQQKQETLEAERKQEELLALKAKLELLESKKRRKTSEVCDNYSEVLRAQNAIDKQLATLTPNAETGLRQLPSDFIVQEAD